MTAYLNEQIAIAQNWTASHPIPIQDYRRLAELRALKLAREGMEPFAAIARNTSGRILTEKLSGADWHNLWKALAAIEELGK